MDGTAARVEEARDCWNDGDLDGYLALYDDAIRLHGFGPAPLGKAEARGLYAGIWAALPAPGRPSPTLTFHEMLVQGSLYSCRFTMSGVHSAAFNGIPATGRPYVMDGVTIMRFAGDRVVERWSTSDFLGLMVQLGAIPAPA